MSVSPLSGAAPGDGRPRKSPAVPIIIGCAGLSLVAIIGMAVVIGFGIATFKRVLEQEIADFSLPFEAQGFERRTGQVMHIRSDILVPTVLVGQVVEIHADTDADLAVLAQILKVHGTIDGTLTFRGQILEITPGAVITGDLDIRGAQSVQMNGRVDGEVHGTWQVMTPALPAPPAPPDAPDLADEPAEQAMAPGRPGQGATGEDDGARWHTIAEASAMFRDLPVRNVRTQTALQRPGGGRFARLVERISPRWLPTGGAWNQLSPVSPWPRYTDSRCSARFIAVPPARKCDGRGESRGRSSLSRGHRFPRARPAARPRTPVRDIRSGRPRQWQGDTGASRRGVGLRRDS